MNIWIDLGHIPQYNFYKQFILTLVQQGHRVFVTMLGRGRLPQIVEHEIGGTPNVSTEVIGHHKMTKWSAIVDVNILRIPKLWFWAIGKHLDIAFSNHHQTGMVAHLLGIPSYAFGDDPQTSIYWFYVHCTTQSHMLIYDDVCHVTDQKDYVLRCTKEWAYLNPRTFLPNVVALDKYNVLPKQYIFLREVSVGTVNYASQAPQAILAVKDLIADTGLKVLFSLEEKHRRNEYPADWILLQEPIEDIHSLMYYSAGLVSSGDSMAREAALLGIPAYYLGTRHSMPANLAASKVANLHNEVTMPFEQWISMVCDSQKSVEDRVKEQQTLRDKIDHEFIDINAYMLSLVDNVAAKQNK
ncbi:MAG: hypothetical protein MJZ79_00155 [Paludibacteraceae bacterium]|nr:hypothetical protein [Paludibacteraceae bacterium]